MQQSADIAWIQSLPPRLQQEARVLMAEPDVLFRLQYGNDPLGFVEDCVDFPDGGGLAPYQKHVLRNFIKNKRTAVKSPRGGGKSALSALLVAWAVLTSDDCKVITTAGTGRQLTKFLWPEIHKWAHRLKWKQIGRKPFSHNELLKEQIVLNDGRTQAFAAVSNDPSKMEGAHAKRIVVIFDEAKIIPDATWDAIEGAFSEAGVGGREAFALAISTPGDLSGRFYDIFQRVDGLEDWKPYSISKEEVIAAGRMSREWADKCRKLWGANSALYLNHIEGQFAPSETGVIPLMWIELANEYWDEWAEAGKPGSFYGLGADIGISNDLSIIAPIFKGEMDFKTINPATGRPTGIMSFLGVDDLRVVTNLNPSTATMTVVGHIKGILDKYGSRAGVVDADGIGAGVGHRLKELGYDDVVLFHAAAKSNYKDETGELEFANMRSAAWYATREMMHPSSDTIVCLPNDRMLTSDLSSPRLKPRTSTNKTAVESKDDLRKAARLGRSTDHGDAVIMGLTMKALHLGGYPIGGTFAMLDLPWSDRPRLGQRV